LNLTKYDDWLIQYVKKVQADGCTTSEADLREEMIDHFKIKNAWAYELIRKIVRRHPHQLVLQKVDIEYGGNLIIPELEIVWVE
jgi:hypothetical protein